MEDNFIGMINKIAKEREIKSLTDCIITVNDYKGNFFAELFAQALANFIIEGGENGYLDENGNVTKQIDASLFALTFTTGIEMADSLFIAVDINTTIKEGKFNSGYIKALLKWYVELGESGQLMYKNEFEYKVLLESIAEEMKNLDELLDDLD